MATKISTEILIIILKNVQSSRSTQDLYSSLLVNRIWCKVAIPILWELPLGQENWIDYGLNKKSLCIRTYISCMNTSTRKLLIQDGFDLSSSPPQATFDYPSFKITAVLKKFSEEFLKYSNLIGSILTFPDAPKVFKKLEYFSSMTIGDDELIRPLYESLTLICDNILKMDLFLGFDSHSQVQLLTNLISVQKRLENLSVVSNCDLYYNSIFWAIISQKETLKSLRLKSVFFNNFERKSSTIGQFISLKELYIDDCYGLHNLDCLSLASSFTQLRRFHYFHSNYIYRYPQEFIIKILETANTNLRNICLQLYHTITFDIESAILNYCTKITKLSLHNLYPDQVIAIFNNNFNELRKFSFDCGEVGFDANELLCQMAENVPKSLEIIKIRMVYKDPWIFSSDSLRKLFEGWCCKGGGNKKLRKFCIKRLLQRKELFSSQLDSPRIYQNHLKPLKLERSMDGMFSADSLRKFFERWFSKGRSLLPKDLLSPLAAAISSEHFKVIEEYEVRFYICLSIPIY
ncbi:11552_t:CDS:2 [Diversispora eburnea]|uniref:11552_t:CDS:1 n=1 Tax=Diversispora eburnea TaxID=1213867 RepID=A0A9N9FSD4_9GLOM|nr:11552_t:CDS:2 [Diversispora eburnea]